MNLREYLYTQDITQKDFARAIGYSEESITKYLSFEHVCSLKLAKAVEYYTKGQVKSDEMIEWSKKGVQEKDKKREEKITPAMRRIIIKDISKCLCESCNKKLTKTKSKSKKIE